MQDASDRGIVVEFVVFCPFYEQNLWDVNPMNARNNVNGIGDLPRDKVYTLQNGKLLDVQDAFIRKVPIPWRNSSPIGSLFSVTRCQVSELRRSNSWRNSPKTSRRLETLPNGRAEPS